jgi:hypothetical protein
VETTTVLLHSPLVGPATWAPVAAELVRAGRPAVVPDLRGVATAAEPWWPEALSAVARAVDAGAGSELVLVPHSNAGLLTPAVAAHLRSLGHRVGACVFVDAAMPAGGDVPLGAPGLVPLLEGLAVDGVLPPWTQWWEPAEVDALLPPVYREAVASEQPRLPLAYFRQRVPVPEGWEPERCAYLRLSDAYLDDAAEAAGQGWRTEHLPAGHLHMLVDPRAVAAALVRLSARPSTPSAPR